MNLLLGDHAGLFNMLRVTLVDCSDCGVRLRVEGRLTGRDVEELRQSCELHMPNDGTRFTLDMADLSFADAEGVELLEDLMRREMEIINLAPFLASQVRARAGGKPQLHDKGDFQKGIAVPLDLDDEGTLVRMSQANSTESFVVLVNRYEQRIYRLSYAVTQNAEDAEDVLRETFLKAYENIRSFKGGSRFYTWLVGIAMEEALTRAGLHQVQAWTSFKEPAGAGEAISTPDHINAWPENPGQNYSAPDLHAILSKALGGLEARLRIVFALRDIAGLSDEETAGVTGLTAAAVREHLTHARLQLREKLSTWFEDPYVLADG